MKGKNIYLTVLGVITCVCIIWGFSRNVSNLFRDANITVNGKKINETPSYIGTNETYGNLEAFDKVVINGRVMAVTILPGDSYTIKATYSKERLKPEAVVKGKVLNITQNPGNINGGNNNCEVIITVPRFTQLEKIDARVNVGEIILKELDSSDVIVHTNVGEVDLKSVSFDSADIKTNVGEINIKLTDAVSYYTIDGKTNVGEVRVKGLSYRRRANLKGSTKKRIEAVTNVGEVNIR